MSRIAATFDRIGREGRGGLVAYVTAGDPDLETSRDILLAVAEAGADVLEVGVPFSDPLADGPVIQRASERALRAGTTLPRVLDLVSEVRRQSDVPIVLFTYANPVVRMTADAFAASAREAGADGALVLDIPVEEAAPLREPILRAGLDPIFLISPTTSDERIGQSAALGAGFLYVISRLGVTGARQDMATDIASLTGRIRRNAALPLALGFGISTPEQVVAACRHADAAVVGSAIVNVIAETPKARAAGAAGEFVRWLKSGL